MKGFISCDDVHISVGCRILCFLTTLYQLLTVCSLE